MLIILLNFFKYYVKYYFIEFFINLGIKLYKIIIILLDVNQKYYKYINVI